MITRKSFCLAMLAMLAVSFAPRLAAQVQTEVPAVVPGASL
jgi:hypothetical protein